MFKTMLVSIILYLIAVFGLSDGSATNEVGSPLQPRIIGGRNTTVNEFPFVVAVLYKGKSHCTGTILSRRFILTVGHSVINRNRDDITVKAGFYVWNDPTAIFRDVKYKRVHPQYRLKKRVGYDIALLKLTAPLDYDPAIQPVILPAFRDNLPDETQGTFVGWGYIQYEPHPVDPLILQALDVTKISRDDCKLSWIKLPRNTMCVSSETSSVTPFKDACLGDSGGPLMVGSVQWGIGAATSVNCSGLYPIQLISVSRFTRWIKITISRDYFKRKRTTAAV
ncbi:trypsin alpha-like isoform X1 [Periplaneta americana]|uniref:trypsin alpha-like isoform X1 n=1 Tax=Periplaneta americana TaxID=6978 RepID=UPI0037E907F9